MGPAGRAEAIHFPSATLKAASREGGWGGGEGGMARTERTKFGIKKVRQRCTSVGAE